MLETAQLAVFWLAAVLLAAVPWLAYYQPAGAPLAAALALVLDPPWRRRSLQAVPRHAVVAVSALGFLLFEAGWRIGGGWLLLAVVVAAAAWWSARRGGTRPDAGDLVLLLGWGGVFLVQPGSLLAGGGGWLAPLVLLVGARRIVDGLANAVGGTANGPSPPEREVEGAIELEKVVLRGRDGLRRSAPLNLRIDPGQSVAVLCDTAEDSELLALTVAGRVPPLEGRILIDGAELHGERVAAVIGPGEPFVAGSVDDNLAACVTGPLTDAARAAVEEACALDDVREELAGGTLAADGSPLSPFHRLLLQAARAIPSHYRIVVVIDPEPWVNRVRAEMWRSAIVRASTGRTAVWITPDRDLAGRAERRFEWRHGRLVPFDASEGAANPGGVS